MALRDGEGSETAQIKQTKGTRQDPSDWIRNEALPIADEATSTANVAFPVRNTTFAFENAALPVRNTVFPIRKAAFAVGDKAFPVGNGASPVGNEAFLVRIRAAYNEAHTVDLEQLGGYSVQGRKGSRH